MYYLYILECADKTFYTGITTDLARRIIEHGGTKLGAKYTSTRRPVKLVYFEKFRNRSLASKEEARIKKLKKNEKIELINNMKNITFITGNQNKADYLEKYLGFSVNHKKIDLDEIQSLDLRKIVEHKIRQAYAKIKKPVIVEDVSLEFAALGRLPGPFIKYFVDGMPLETICSLIDGKTRKATARCVFGYFDGKILRLFEGKLDGEIAAKPAGENGYGWDKIFIPEGYTVTRASLNEENDRKTYLKTKPFAKLKKFLLSRK
jgi:inosine triphosphate pyrophosphatase